MRIIGGRDYYDSAVPFDTDSSRIFHRKPYSDDNDAFVPLPILEELHSYTLDIWDGKHELWRDPRFDYDHGWTEDRVSHYFYARYVVFAGNLYKGIAHRTEGHGSNYAVKRTVYWDLPSFEEVLASLKLEFCPPNKFDRYYKETHVNDQTKFEYFDPTPVTGDAYKYLVDNNHIILIGKHFGPKKIANKYYEREVRWQSNTDGLRELRFTTAYDAWAAYQELDMFLGTILVKDEDKQVVISDKSKARKHGFDERSFRNTHHRAKPRRAS